MIIKPLTAIWFTSKKEKILCSRNLLALLLAALVSNGGYYLAEVIFSGNWLAPLATQWGGLVQSGGSAVVFCIIALALDKLHIRDQLRL